MNRFIYMRRRGGPFYVAADQIVEIDCSAESAKLRDGTTAEFVFPLECHRLLDMGADIVRGVDLETGGVVSAPLASLDCAVDRFDEASDGWIAVATTKGGTRFVVAQGCRWKLDLDGEMEDLEQLGGIARRLRGGAPDPAADAAVEAAEAAAGGVPGAKAG